MNNQSSPNLKSRRYQMNFTAKEESVSKQGRNRPFRTRLESSTEHSPSSQLTFEWSFNVSPGPDATVSAMVRMVSERHETRDIDRSPEADHKWVTTDRNTCMKGNLLKDDEVVTERSKVTDGLSNRGINKQKISDRNNLNVAEFEHPLSCNAKTDGATSKNPAPTKNSSAIVTSIKHPKLNELDSKGGAICKKPMLTKDRSSANEVRKNSYLYIAPKVDTGRHRQTQAKTALQSNPAPRLQNDTYKIEARKSPDMKKTVLIKPDRKSFLQPTMSTSSNIQPSVRSKNTQETVLTRSKSSDITRIKKLPHILSKQSSDATGPTKCSTNSISPPRMISRRSPDQDRHKQDLKIKDVDIASPAVLSKMSKYVFPAKIQPSSSKFVLKTRSVGLSNNPTTVSQRSSRRETRASSASNLLMPLIPAKEERFDKKRNAICLRSKAPARFQDVFVGAEAANRQEVEDSNNLLVLFFPKHDEHEDSTSNSVASNARKLQGQPNLLTIHEDVHGNKRISLSEGQVLVEELIRFDDLPASMYYEAPKPARRRLWSSPKYSSSVNNDKLVAHHQEQRRRQTKEFTPTDLEVQRLRTYRAIRTGSTSSLSSRRNTDHGQASSLFDNVDNRAISEERATVQSSHTANRDSQAASQASNSVSRGADLGERISAIVASSNDHDIADLDASLERNDQTISAIVASINRRKQNLSTMVASLATSWRDQQIPSNTGGEQREIRATPDINIPVTRHCEDNRDLEAIFLNTMSYKFTNIFYSEECTICLEFFGNEQQVRRLPCMHLFHKDCIDKWLVIRAVCPNCLSKL